MLSLFYALITVLAWGLWLTPSQTVGFRGQQVRTFYVAATNLTVAFVVAAGQAFGGLTWAVFWWPFIGGLIWALSALCAFTATERLGMATACGTWAPLNIIVSLVLGVVLFGEFLSSGLRTWVLLFGSVIAIISGILMVVFAKGTSGRTGPRGEFLIGLGGTLAAGVLWGVYFLPVKLSHASMWVAAFPLACGIFFGSSALVIFARQPLRLEKSSDYLRSVSTGALWSVGNYGMLLLVDRLGAGKGYTIAQLALVVNALAGIYVLHDPPPRSRAARLTLIGCALATCGGIVLGALK